MLSPGPLRAGPESLLSTTKALPAALRFLALFQPRLAPRFQDPSSSPAAPGPAPRLLGPLVFLQQSRIRARGSSTRLPPRRALTRTPRSPIFEWVLNSAIISVNALAVLEDKRGATRASKGGKKKNPQRAIFAFPNPALRAKPEVNLRRTCCSQIPDQQVIDCSPREPCWSRSHRNPSSG